MAYSPWSRGADVGAVPPSAQTQPIAARSTDPLSLPTEWVGQRGTLFFLALRTSLYTILTLGFYRFWMKTRLRRWYWSSIRPGGVPLEYTGDPIEKLLGFLMAVVILAFYIGIVNLILMFVSYSLLANNFAAYAASLIGVIPLWFFASYRARRYVLARTRWAGIRFGLDNGAWGYAARALWHWGLTIITLGLLWPRMTFALEKYKVDRTWFGTAQLAQGGDWKMLYRPFLGVVLPAAISALCIVLALIGDSPRPLAVLALTLPWCGFAALHYQVNATRVMANHKTAGGIALTSQASSGRVMGIYALGYFLTYLAVLVPFFLLAFMIGYFFVGPNGDFIDFNRIQGAERYAVWAATIVIYFAVFLSWSVLRHTFVTLPLWQHYAQTLTVKNAPDLAHVKQRARDDLAEAEGFAEALDLGAAI